MASAAENGGEARYRDTQEERRSLSEPPPTMPFKVLVSPRFIITSLLASMLLAFSVGRAARIILIEGSVAARQSTLRDAYTTPHDPPLPLLIAKEGKQIPHTRYTAKMFDTARSALSSSWLVTSQDIQAMEEGDARLCPSERDEEETCENTDDDKGEPSGEHLMVDIKNVDPSFLNSEKQLARAMVDVVNEAELTLLSYHCHGLSPAGVSCVGLLLHNYVSFHTWPVEGVITLDLCSGSPESILPVLPIIERRFSVPRKPTVPGQVLQPPMTRWAHKLRGFQRRESLRSSLFLSTDLGDYILGDLGYELKEEVASVETDFQRIDIYDILHPTMQSLSEYRKSISDEDNYESRHPDLYKPDRVVMLDGWLQSTLHDEAAYHEALVHPAMFAHEHPKRVAIIGGGEGATLREVLKHNTVEEAVMIEIDEMMVNVSRQYLPEWSDCTDLVGSAPWCVDDDRSHMYYEDAFAWFMNRYSNGQQKEELMDIIIMDALDPESEVPFAVALYSNDSFMRAFYDSLSDDGILVMQLGQAPELSEPDETYSLYKNRAATTGFLEKLGFESIHAYEESHCGFRAPWSYVVAFKSYETRKRWYANAAEVDVAIHERCVPTKSGANPFRYFDGATMVSYQIPPRAMETVFCRRVPTPETCVDGSYSFAPENPNIPASSFEVKMSGVGSKAGRGIFSKVKIPKSAYLSAETNVNPVVFKPSTFELITKLEKEEIGGALEVLDYYMHGYGFISQVMGGQECTVDSGILTFANHGCKGTYNIGTETSFDETTANVDVMDEKVKGRSHFGTTKFNPMVDRHLHFNIDEALRAIKPGEELLDNYLAFIGDETFWAEGVKQLRDECSGTKVGDVTEYENETADSESTAP